MKAVLAGTLGGPEVLRLGEVDEPHAGPGEVRISVRAVGVNPIDWKIRSDNWPFPVELPFVPGIEAAGVVDEVGADVDGVALGDQVFGLTRRGTAQYAVLRAWAAKPAALSWAEAAAVASSAETATRTLDLLGLVSGQTIVVNGASGSVGTAAVQLARLRGAIVIGTASEANHDVLRDLGATPVTYGDGLFARVRELAPQGVDLALDTAGRGALPDLIALTSSPDRVVTIADPDAEALGVRFSGSGDRGDALAPVAGLIEAGRYRVTVARTFPMAETGEAHRIGQAGHGPGKLVVLVE